MKAILSILALAIVLLATPAWAQPGDHGGNTDAILGYIAFENLTVTHDAGDIVISAAITIADDRFGHALDRFSCHTNEHGAWGFAGQFGDDGDAYYFLNTDRTEPDCNGVSLRSADGEPTPYPVTITDSRFTLRIPSSHLSGNRFTYHFAFYESASGNGEMWFEGTFERADSTPARRVSWGMVKAAYR